MRRAADPDLDKGYFTFVQNTPDVDYLRIAYLQGLSIKATQGINKYAIAVDKETEKLITNEHEKVFDRIVVMAEDDAADEDWKLENEWKAWALTPFKETVKLDADILFTRNIDHWWNILQNRDICCTVNIRNIANIKSESDKYRKLFTLNNLPNVYSGFTYFRYTATSQKFYSYVRAVFKEWPLFRDKILKDCRHDKANTDEAYAIAAMLLGEEECFNAASDIPTFVHMKGAINGWPDMDWTKLVYAQVDDNANVTVGFNRQLYPFHYVNKEFASEELIGRYERIVESLQQPQA